MMPAPAVTKTATSADLLPPAYFGEALADAERLLKYAAETGVEIDDDTRDHVLQARAAAEWTEETTANLLVALTKLASQLRPVTAASLKACSDETRPTIRTYWIVAICLAIVIVPFFDRQLCFFRDYECDSNGCRHR
jgi:hypothetical protein